jgi:OmpA-OmpF porin, OOP family
MNQLKLLCVLMMFALISACAGTGNGGTGGGSGFVTKSGGLIWKNRFGECWGHSGRTADSSHPECGGAAPSMAPAATEETGYFWPDDQDRDGVVDAKDGCPFTPDGIKVDSNGCALDDDGDGVPNYLDSCPSTPAGTVVNTDGCGRTIVSLSGVHFAFDSASLTSEAKSILDNAANTINSRSGASFTVEGHTDSNGPDDYNQGLSERRANSVKNYLVSQGVPASGLSTVGKGESSPVSSNDTRAGRAENRRVDVLAY